MKTVIEMAREAGAGEPVSMFGRTDYVVMTRSDLERFAALVTAEKDEKIQDLEDMILELQERNT